MVHLRRIFSCQDDSQSFASYRDYEAGDFDEDLDDGTPLLSRSVPLGRCPTPRMHYVQAASSEVLQLLGVLVLIPCNTRTKLSLAQLGGALALGPGIRAVVFWRTASRPFLTGPLGSLVIAMYGEKSLMIISTKPRDHPHQAARGNVCGMGILQPACPGLSHSVRGHRVTGALGLVVLAWGPSWSRNLPLEVTTWGH